MRKLFCLFGYFVFTVFVSGQKYDFVVLNASEGETNSTYVKSQSNRNNDGEYRLYDYVELAEGDSATVCTIHQLETTHEENVGYMADRTFNHTRLALEREEIGIPFVFNVVNEEFTTGGVSWGTYTSGKFTPKALVLPGPGKVYLSIQDHNASNRSNYNSRVTLRITRAEDQHSEYKLLGSQSEELPSSSDGWTFVEPDYSGDNITEKNGFVINTQNYENSISGETTTIKSVFSDIIVLESGDYAQVVSEAVESSYLNIFYNFDTELHDEFDEYMELSRLDFKGRLENEERWWELHKVFYGAGVKTEFDHGIGGTNWIVGPCIIDHPHDSGYVLKISRASDTGSKTLAWTGTSWEADDDSRQASTNSSQQIDPTNIKYDTLFGWAYFTDSNWVYSYTNLSWYYLQSSSDGIYVWNANLPNNGWMKWNRG